MRDASVAARHASGVAVIDEQHLALMVGPVRIAAAGAAATHDMKRVFKPLPAALCPIVGRQVEWSRVWSEAAAGGFRESLRRCRENPRPDLGPPDVLELAAELVASLAETYAALRVARGEIDRADLSAHAEPVVGRYGELAAQVAEWATSATEVQRQVGERELRQGVRWGPHPGDARVGAPVALALSACFAMSSALGSMAMIDDNRLAGGDDASLQPVFDVAVQALWAATELATGVAVCLEHLVTDGHAWPNDALNPADRCLESMARYREAVAVQLEDLDRYQPVDAQASRPGYVLVLKRLDEHTALLCDELDKPA